jgi:hypothetical protein
LEQPLKSGERIQFINGRPDLDPHVKVVNGQRLEVEMEIKGKKLTRLRQQS